MSQSKKMTNAQRLHVVIGALRVAREVYEREAGNMEALWRDTGKTDEGTRRLWKQFERQAMQCSQVEDEIEEEQDAEINAPAVRS